jgi:RNA polymerase sigma factor (sigma-70 family)
MDEHRRQGSVDMRATRKMATTEPTSEEDLAALLPEEPELFIRFLHEDYRKKLAACVGKHGRGLLNAHDIKDVLQKAFIAVWEKVQEPSFDASQPVLPMVFTIARNKAIDARRKKLRLQKIGVNETDVTDLVISDMAGSNLAFDYRYASEEEKRRLEQILPGIVAELPERQRLAVNAFFECYEEIREKNKHRLVAEAMSRMCGEVVDVAAAKSALRAGLEKVKRELARQGVGFVDRRDA